MRKTIALAGLLHLAGALFSGARAGDDALVDPAYEGKYDDATIRPFLETAARIAPASLRCARRALGLPDTVSPAPKIRICDLAPLKPGRYKGPHAKTVAEAGPEGLELVIVFHAESLVNGSGDFEKRLLHEMVHASMRLSLGDDKYKRCPRWLREGIALAVAGQGPSRVRYEFSITLDAGALLQGLDEIHGPKDYAEDFLAVDFLLRRGGDRALPRLLRLLREGVPPPRAVERTARVDPGRFETSFRSAVLPALETSAASERSRFLPPFRLFQRQEYAQALEGFETFVKGPPEAEGILAGSLEGKALYYRAKSLFQLGRIEEALAGFATVRRDHACTCGLADDASFFEGECLLRSKRLEPARSAFRRFVRDHPHSNFAALGWHKLGLCHYLGGEYQEALELCQGVVEAFPKARIAENAHYDAANALRALGKKEEALALFRRFLETYPGSRFRGLAKAHIEALEKQ